MQVLPASRVVKGKLRVDIEFCSLRSLSEHRFVFESRERMSTDSLEDRKMSIWTEGNGTWVVMSSSPRSGEPAAWQFAAICRWRSTSIYKAWRVDCDMGGVVCLFWLLDVFGLVLFWMVG